MHWRLTCPPVPFTTFFLFPFHVPLPPSCPFPCLTTCIHIACTFFSYLSLILSLVRVFLVNEWCCFFSIQYFGLVFPCVVFSGLYVRGWVRVSLIFLLPLVSYFLLLLLLLFWYFWYLYIYLVMSLLIPFEMSITFADTCLLLLCDYQSLPCFDMSIVHVFNLRSYLLQSPS